MPPALQSLQCPAHTQCTSPPESIRLPAQTSTRILDSAHTSQEIARWIVERFSPYGIADRAPAEFPPAQKRQPSAWTKSSSQQINFDGGHGCGSCKLPRGIARES